MKLLVGLNVFLVVVVVMSLYVQNRVVLEHKKTDRTIYEFELSRVDGTPMPLGSFKNQVVLIVNTASLCGFTKQYKGLQELYNRFASKGLVIIAVPSNDFASQEPSSNTDIQSFCRINFGVTFLIASKVSVKGDAIHPLYAFLTDKTLHPDTGGAINWNFNKFLVDKNGHVVQRYASFKRPLSRVITRDIERYLND